MTVAMFMIGAMLIMSTGGADASPETACKAAAARDKRVDYGFCVSQLSAQNGSAGADAWGLAKAAAHAGSWYAGDTEAQIEAMLRNPRTDPKENGALGECMELYHHARQLFGTAWGEINRRDYEAAKRTVAGVAPDVAYCDEYFANAGLRPPFVKQNADSTQLAVICAAIIDLVGR